MTPEALVVATIVGILAGTHTATWGMYKDAPHEGFRPQDEDDQADEEEDEGDSVHGTRSRASKRARRCGPA